MRFHRLVVRVAIFAMVGACCVGRAEEAVSQASQVDMPTLSAELSAAQARVVQRIQQKEDPEVALAAQYEKLQILCNAKFQALDSDYRRYSAAETRTNVLGAFVSLIGSVTAFAPGKTILMGLGISSSGSGSVTSGITSFFSKRSTEDAASLAILKAQLAQVFDRYDAVDAGSDSKGLRRSGILSRGTSICLGLTPGDDQTKANILAPVSLQ